MAAELAASNAAYLRGRTGREPGGGDLYAAHFLGPAGAATADGGHGHAARRFSAAALFPQAAAANRSIFYRDGRPATVAEVHANLQRTAGEHPAVGAPQQPSAPPATVERTGPHAGCAPGPAQQDQSLLALLLGTRRRGEGDGIRQGVRAAGGIAAESTNDARNDVPGAG